MWIISTTGFFSIVQKAPDQGLTVRARVREDLESLRENYIPELSPIEEDSGTDYRFRCAATHRAVSNGLRKMVDAIGYPNFKSEVQRLQGQDRADCYGQVWIVLSELSKIPIGSALRSSNALRERRLSAERSLRVLNMVSELHKLGHQRLRIFCGYSPSGVAWRCGITHSGNVLKSDGGRPKDFSEDSVHFSSASEAPVFEWEDSAGDSPRDLATKFLSRYPELAAKGRGSDWLYAGWYQQMLGKAEAFEFPLMYGEEYIAFRERPPWLLTTKAKFGQDSGLPVPPPGEADKAES